MSSKGVISTTPHWKWVHKIWSSNLSTGPSSRKYHQLDCQGSTSTSLWLRTLIGTVTAARNGEKSLPSLWHAAIISLWEGEARSCEYLHQLNSLNLTKIGQLIPGVMHSFSHGVMMKIAERWATSQRAKSRELGMDRSQLLDTKM